MVHNFSKINCIKNEIVNVLLYYLCSASRVTTESNECLGNVPFSFTDIVVGSHMMWCPQLPNICHVIKETTPF